MVQLLAHSLLPTLLIGAALSDVMDLRIPNWLNLLIALLFVPMAWLSGMGWWDIGTHIATGLGLLAVGIGLFQFGLFGGGDGKLMAAAGMWFGPFQFFSFLMMTAIVGGILAIVLGAWTSLLLWWEMESGEKGSRLLSKLRENSPSIPYGLAFAVGGILAFKNSWWMVGFS